MRRAMQTCIGMFKDHPKVAEIKFIVVPLVREILHTVCDMPICVHELIRTFAKGEEACQGIEFDFSLLMHGEPQYWTINTLCNPAKISLFWEKLASMKPASFSDYQPVRDALL